MNPKIIVVLMDRDTGKSVMSLTSTLVPRIGEILHIDKLNVNYKIEDVVYNVADECGGLVHLYATKQTFLLRFEGVKSTDGPLYYARFKEDAKLVDSVVAATALPIDFLSHMLSMKEILLSSFKATKMYIE